MTEQLWEDWNALSGRFLGTSLECRSRGTDWPWPWRATIVASKNERDDYRIVKYGPSAELVVHGVLEDVKAIDHKLHSKLKPEEDSERCVCAALLLSDGYIVRGHRHHDCLRSVSEMVGRTEQGSVQGFLTTRGRFVDRAEGARLEGLSSLLLFSEDLY